ncbi:MAG: hypothetical protein NZ772_15420 [Cyanobacteria bacterium]|nr:hypothetical protein [Cyanobacteriota bacterium]
MLSCNQPPNGLHSGVTQSSQTLAKPSVDVTSVREISARSQQNITVYLEGTVGRQVPLAGSQVYELVDATGSIWVVTQGTNLTPGDQVLIQGIVRYQPIRVGGNDLGESYVEEQRQLFHKPSQASTL